VPYRIRFVGSTEVMQWILSSNSTRLWGLPCGTSHICGENAGQLAGQHLLGSVCRRPPAVEPGKTRDFRKGSGYRFANPWTL
jgi:hypothetical protein